MGWGQVDVGGGGVDVVVANAERLLEAQLDTPGAEKGEVLEEHLQFARSLDQVSTDRYSKGVADAAQLASAKYWRWEVEVRLERAKQDPRK